MGVIRCVMKLNIRYVFNIVLVGVAGVATGCGSGSGAMVPKVTTVTSAPGAVAPGMGCVTSYAQAVQPGAIAMEDEEVVDGIRGSYHLASALVILNSNNAPVVPAQGQAAPPVTYNPA